MSIANTLMPAGLARFLAWRQKFENIGFSPARALEAAASHERKRAYVDSRIEHLPRALKRALHCVVDVGANRGQWAAALLSLCSPASFDAFEPNAEALAELERAIGGRVGVRLHALALGRERGTRVLHVTNRSEFASFNDPDRKVEKYYATGAMEIAREVEVEVDTLDHALAELGPIDLLKIDVQGAEREVLAGGSRVLARTRALLIEANLVSHYRGDESLASLVDLLAASEFELWDLAPPFHADDGRALWCDAVFVRR